MNEVFTPTPQDTARAAAIVEAYRDARARGEGVVAVDGAFIAIDTMRMGRAHRGRGAARRRTHPIERARTIMAEDASPAAPSVQPLTGIRVLDIATFLAGPFCSTQLGEFGADVITVELPGTGDPLRRFGSPTAAGDTLVWLSEIP